MIKRRMALLFNARSVFCLKYLTVKLWAKAFNTTVHVLNRKGSTSVVKKSLELWRGNRKVSKVVKLAIVEIKMDIESGFIIKTK